MLGSGAVGVGGLGGGHGGRIGGAVLPQLGAQVAGAVVVHEDGVALRVGCVWSGLSSFVLSVIFCLIESCHLVVSNVLSAGC